MLHLKQVKREAVAVLANILRLRLLSLLLTPLSVAVVAHGRLFLSQNLRLQPHQVPREAVGVPARTQVWGIY